MRRWVLGSATLAPVALVGGWTLGAARQPAGYDPLRDTISALAAHGAVDRWVMTVGLAVLGGCHVLTALGLEEGSASGRALFGLGGVSTALVAAFPQPSAGHFPAAAASFVALALWPFASRLPRPTTGRLATVGLLALLAWLGVELRGGALLGLSERLLAGAEALWPLAVALAVRRRGTPAPAS